MICTSSLDALDARIHCDYENDLWTFTWSIQPCKTTILERFVQWFRWRKKCVSGYSAVICGIWLYYEAAHCCQILVPDNDSVELYNNITPGQTVTTLVNEHVNMVPIIKSNYMESNLVIDIINNPNNLSDGQGCSSVVLSFGRKIHNFLCNF